MCLICLKSDGTICLPGDLVTAAQIGAEVTARRKPVVNTDPDEAVYVIVYFPYKNGAEIEKCLLRIKEARKTYDETKDPSDFPEKIFGPGSNQEDFDCYDGVVVIHGSGGSAALAGAFAGSARSQRRDDGHVVGPAPQDTRSATSQCYFELHARRKPFMVFQNRHTWASRQNNSENWEEGRPHKKARKEQMDDGEAELVCLGLYIIKEIKYTQCNTWAEVAQRFDADFLSREENIQFASYMMQPHLEVICEPAVPDGFYKEIALKKCDSKAYKPIVISAENEEPIQIPVGDKPRVECFKMTPAKILNEYLKTDDWMKYEKISGQTDKEVGDAPKEKEEGLDLEGNPAMAMQYRTDANGLAEAMLHVSAAGAYRYLQEGCFVDEKAKPFTDGYACNLINSLKLASIPNPGRCCDPVPVFVRSNLIDYLKSRKLNHSFSFDKITALHKGLSCKSMPASTQWCLSSCLFRIMLVRFMGRTRRLEEWAAYCDDLGVKVQCSIPGPNQRELGTWFAFLDALTKKRPKQAMTDALSAQHVNRIPSELCTFHGYRDALNKLSKNNASVLQKILATAQTRREIVQALAETILESATGGTVFKLESDKNKKSCLFLAHQCIADLEEVVGFIFGKVTEDSVHTGYGGDNGHKLFYSAKSKGNLREVLPLQTVYDEVVAILVSLTSACIFVTTIL